MFTSRITFAVALVAAAASLAGASDKRAMTPEDTVGIGTVSDPRISPDGSRVVFVYSEVDRQANLFASDLWIVPTDGSQPPRRLTTSLEDDTTPVWSPDGKWIAFLSKRDAKRRPHGEEKDRKDRKAQIWLMSAAGGEAQPLTEAKGGVVGATWSGGGFSWSPDGKRVAFVSPETPTDEERKRIDEKWDMVVVDKDLRMHQLWVVDVSTKQMRQLTSDRRDVGDPQWSPDGRDIAFVTRPTPKADDGLFSDIAVVAADGGSPRVLTRNPASDVGPRWSPDGTRLAYLCGTQAQSGGQSDICVVTAAGGAPRNLTERFDRNEGNLSWSPNGRSIYFEANVGVNRYAFAVPADGGEVAPLHAGNRVVSFLDVSSDGTLLTYVSSDPQHPGDVWVARVDGSNARAISRMNPHVDDYLLGTTEIVRWKNAEGQDIEGVLVRATGADAARPCPTIVEPHGGPAGIQTTAFRKEWQVLAGSGFCVFAPNFRGSDGYGRRFIEANIGQWGTGDYQDIMSGVDFLVAQGIADPDRLGVEGWSYGGYMTNRIVTQTDRFKAAVSGAGLSNLLSFFGTTDIQRFTMHYMTGQPWKAIDVYARSSPIAAVANVKTPLLLLHGEEDRRVPIEQAEQMYMSLRHLGVVTEFVRYPREPHGLQEPNHQIDRLHRMTEWFTRHVTKLPRT